jgi:type II secretion system protein I
MRHKDSARKRTGKKGFTLLEILVSLAIMAIAITLVMQLFSANLRAVAKAGDMTLASVRGDSRIREILAEPSLTETAWSETTEDGYRMDVAISEVMKEKTDNLPVRLMEVALTVHWMEGIREKSLSLKTMKMVDKAAPAG